MFTITTNYKSNFRRDSKIYKFPAPDEDFATAIFEQILCAALKYGMAPYMVDMILTNENKKIITMVEF